MLHQVIYITDIGKRTVTKIIFVFTFSLISFYQTQVASLQHAAIISVREKKYKNYWPDFTHVSTKYFFLVSTGMKMHIYLTKIQNIFAKKKTGTA